MRFVDTSRIRTRLVEPIAAADGTLLSLDLYLPPEPGEYPVLVTRTPYDNNRQMRALGVAPPAERFKIIAAHGFIVVAGDVRGRGDSEGEFTPFLYEAGDGIDTLNWARSLPESNGKLGVFGSGYAGFCAWAAAEAADSVLAISPFGAPFEGMPWRNGTLRLDWLHWMHLVALRVPPQPVDPVAWDWVWRQLPIRDLDEAVGHERIWWKDWVDHDQPGSYWAPLDLADVLSKLDIPALHMTGWWDPGLAATRSYWEALQRSAGRDRQHLVIGPWTGTATRAPDRRVGGVDFGIRSVVDPMEELLSWFGETLRGEEPKEPRSPARLFVPGGNEWQSFDRWPEGSSRRTWWLSSKGNANSRAGDGRLVTAAPPEGGAADQFKYHPDMPVPWQPYFTSFSANTPISFTLDEGHVTSRDDVLVYTSDPLTEPLVLLGRPRLLLHVETDAPTTDWFATISDVFPFDSRTIHLCHAAMHAQGGELDLEFSDVGYELLPGHRLRLTVTSSLFPLYAVSPHVPGPRGQALELRPAEQRVFHDHQHPSRLELPVDS